MNEAQKNERRRQECPEYGSLFKGKGIDIGCGATPVRPDCDTWDKGQGDATYMAGMQDEKYDWVFSSHCLEHVERPDVALENWFRLVKPGGHLIVTIPCFFLYEKKQWPSRFNGDHKQRFSILADPRTITVSDLLSILKRAQVRWIRTNDEGFDYEDQQTDQTRGKAQSEIEFVVRKMEDNFWTY